MTDFRLDVDGVDDLTLELEGLREQYSTERVYVTGTNADYAVHLEFGRGPIEADDGEALRFEDENGDVIYRSSVSGHPPYPFFRPAISGFKHSPNGFIRRNTGYSGIDEIPSGNELVKSVATALARQMEKNASANTASSRSPGTHPNHPQRDSGNLVASIGATRIR